MELFETLEAQERARNEYWNKKDYFLPLRLKWRAQMVRHLFHLLPGESIGTVPLKYVDGISRPVAGKFREFSTRYTFDKPGTYRLRAVFDDSPPEAQTDEEKAQLVAYGASLESQERADEIIAEESLGRVRSNSVSFEVLP